MPRHRHVSSLTRVRLAARSPFVHLLCATPARVAPHSICGELWRPGRGRGDLPMPGLDLLCARCAAMQHAEGNRLLVERLEASA